MTDRFAALSLLIARVVLGAIFLVFGANGFLQFLPAPELTPASGAFFGALAAAGYLLPLLKATEVVAGALLLSNRAVPLALVLLAPIVINIAGFHLWLQPGLPMVVLLVALESYLAYRFRDAFRPLFRSTRSVTNLAETPRPGSGRAGSPAF
jgi:uncharacterized membrane protein YphA (DoxX/SURF4 family)